MIKIYAIERAVPCCSWNKYVSESHLCLVPPRSVHWILSAAGQRVGSQFRLDDHELRTTDFNKSIGSDPPFKTLENNLTCILEGRMCLSSHATTHTHKTLGPFFKNPWITFKNSTSQTRKSRKSSEKFRDCGRAWDSRPWSSQIMNCWR